LALECTLRGCSNLRQVGHGSSIPSRCGEQEVGGSSSPPQGEVDATGGQKVSGPGFAKCQRIVVARISGVLGPRHGSTVWICLLGMPAVPPTRHGQSSTRAGGGALRAPVVARVVWEWRRRWRT